MALTPLIDSRKVIDPSNSVFYAINGNNNDGHNYIELLYKKGVRHFVVERGIDDSKYPDAQFRKVADAKVQLQQDAKNHRLNFDIPVLAITGSNGKTIVKEWLAEMLDHDHRVAKSPGSYNSQVGVPLSVFGIKPYHTIGIFEAGISEPNEMPFLQEIIQPNYGILTNIGSAHDSGFESRIQKAEEKLQLFENVDKLIYRYEKISTAIHALVQKKELNAFSWSLNTSLEADLTFNKEGDTITGTYEGVQISFNLPYSDSASVENLIHCIVFLLIRGYEPQQIQERIDSLKPISMRLEVKKGLNNCYLIDDSYNNDLGGLQIALDFLEQNQQRKKRTVIISDILQSGMDPEKLYEEVNRLLVAKKVNRVIGIGNTISKYSHQFMVDEIACFKTTEHLLRAVITFKDEVILVKGARDFQFEQIVKRLTYQQHRTRLEINMDALVHNLNFYRSFLKPKTKIMVMVKAFAYGGGSFEIANLLQYQQVDYLAVAYADEGVELRKNGIHIPIMVMNPSVEDFENICNYRLEPEIYSFQLLDQWITHITSLDYAPKIHLKIDTGMHRLGFESEDINLLIKSIVLNKEKLGVASAFSHLATSDDPENPTFLFEQITKFKRIANDLEQHLEMPITKHVLNSSGIANFSDMQMDMVRLGIGLYGIDPSGVFQKKLELVTTLKSVISQIKDVKQGETVGYGRVGKAENDIRVATIAIGYADGLNRGLSDGVGKVYINGQSAPIIGNVCMDMIMVNVTKVQCEAGDEVEIFGKHISINTLAKQLDTIPYEILTSVSERVKRIYFRE